MGSPRRRPSLRGRCRAPPGSRSTQLGSTVLRHVPGRALVRVGEAYGGPSNSKVLTALLASPDLLPATKADLALYQEIANNDPSHIVFPAGYQAQFDASFKRNFDAVTFDQATVAQAVDTFFSEVDPSLG